MTPAQDEAPDSALKALRTRLVEAGEGAVKALREMAESGEGAPRVKAAEAILDRIGLRGKDVGGGMELSAEALLKLVSGLATLAGRSISPEALKAQREAALREAAQRNVSPTNTAARPGRTQALIQAAENAERND